MFTAVLVCLVSLLVFYFILTRKKGRYPLGPHKFPIIGNLPQLALAGSISKFAQHYKQIYGNVFTFEFGGNKRVVISGYETMHSLLVKNADCSSNRTPNSMSEKVRELIKSSPGLVWAPFPHWKTLRSFAISTLREGGMGKKSMEPRIHDEIEQYLDCFIVPNLGKPVDITSSLIKATCNVVSQLIFAKRFEYDDKNLTEILSAIDDTVKLAVKIAMVEYIPFGKHFVKSALAQEEHIYENVLRSKLQKYIDEHSASVDSKHPRNVTDRYILHSRQAYESSQLENSFTEENAWVFIFHLFGAGTETTATELRWALLFVCLHPHVQTKIMEEIDEHIGEKVVTYQDRLNMPYTEAVLLETLRKANVASTSLPHSLNKDMVLDGTFIPAGADLMLNMASVLHDETVFEEPEKFKPERYLTGDIALKKQRTISFGIGRRACPGESLAKMEMFLFFVTFLQRYNITFADKSSVTDEAVELLLHSPKPYKLIFTRRH